jgi:hypothetical protein
MIIPFFHKGTGESGLMGYYKWPSPVWPQIQTIKFKKPFEETPALTYGYYILDADHKQNLRVNTILNHVTKSEFQIKQVTWQGSKLYGAKMSWMACGR